MPRIIPEMRQGRLDAADESLKKETEDVEEGEGGGERGAVGDVGELLESLSSCPLICRISVGQRLLDP